MLKLFLNDIKKTIGDAVKSSLNQPLDTRKDYICNIIQSKKKWPGEVRRHLEKLFRALPEDAFTAYSTISQISEVSSLF